MCRTLTAIATRYILLLLILILGTFTRERGRCMASGDMIDLMNIEYQVLDIPGHVNITIINVVLL